MVKSPGHSGFAANASADESAEFGSPNPANHDRVVQSQWPQDGPFTYAAKALRARWEGLSTRTQSVRNGRLTLICRATR